MAMHAHKCTVCEARGVQTIWIHGDEQGGSKTAHKCPKCGSENWAKFMVEAGQLPNQQQQQHSVIQVVRLSDALMMAFSYALMILIILAIVQNWDRIVAYIQKVRQQ